MKLKGLEKREEEFRRNIKLKDDMFVSTPPVKKIPPLPIFGLPKFGKSTKGISGFTTKKWTVINPIKNILGKKYSLKGKI